MPVGWKLNLRDFTGALITDRGHLAPMDLSWEKNLNQSGSVACGLSLRDERYVAHDWISPYAQDWQLQLNDGITYQDDIFMEGVVTKHAIDAEGELSLFGGQDYLHLFERRGYPFDPNNTSLYTRLWSSNTDISTIVHDIINTVLARPNTSFAPTIVATAVGATQHFNIQAGDSSSLVNFIESFAQGYPGFDFGFTVDPTTFHIWPIEYDQQHTTIYEFREDLETGAIQGVTDGPHWTNNGPSGTHAFGQGAGTSTTRGQNYNYIPAQLIYRRMDIYPSFGDLMSDTHVSRATAGALGIALAPVYELTMTVRPDFIKTDNGFYRDFVPGAYIFIRKDLKAHLLDGKYKIVQMQGNVDSEGNDTVTLNCNRETDLSLNFSDTTS